MTCRKNHLRNVYYRHMVILMVWGVWATINYYGAISAWTLQCYCLKSLGSHWDVLSMPCLCAINCPHYVIHGALETILERTASKSNCVFCEVEDNHGNHSIIAIGRMWFMVRCTVSCPILLKRPSQESANCPKHNLQAGPHLSAIHQTTWSSTTVSPTSPSSCRAERHQPTERYHSEHYNCFVSCDSIVMHWKSLFCMAAGSVIDLPDGALFICPLEESENRRLQWSLTIKRAANRLVWLWLLRLLFATFNLEPKRWRCWGLSG